MDNHIKVLELLNQKQFLELELKQLIYGSIEVRNKDSKKYIYTHIKENGVSKTKYIGEYSEELYNLIVVNNIKAKEFKKHIRKIEKQLKDFNYVDRKLSKDISINIDFARKHLAKTIYKQAILEGVATTLSDTKSIIEGGKINNMSAEDVMKIINLKHAWDFILNKNVLLSPTNYALLCSINKLVEEGFYYNAGYLRTTPIQIGGTSWYPNIPIEADVKDDIKRIINKKMDYVDKSIELLLYVVKKQLFIDGNKRTSVIFANHYLIQNAKGLIVIPDTKTDEYKKLLIEYYETSDDKKIKDFIKDKCYYMI